MLTRFNDYLNTRTRYKITFVAYADEIKLYIKAKMAEQLFGDEAYTQIINSNDVMLTRVNELIKE
jgi:carboxyl-terminal processing protease